MKCIETKRLEESIELTQKELDHLKECQKCLHIREETEPLRKWLNAPFDPEKEFDPDIEPPSNPWSLVEGIWPEIQKMAEAKKGARITFDDLKTRIADFLKRSPEDSEALFTPQYMEDVMAYMEEYKVGKEVSQELIEQALIEKGCSPELAKELSKKMVSRKR